MQLHEIQASMSQALFVPLTQTKCVSSQEADALLKSSDNLKALDRLEIYRTSYWYRLIDAFYDDFPGLLALLGARAFDRLTRAYIAERPSRSFTLRNLGRYLVPWLADNAEFLGKEHDIAIDMAKLEWADIEAFDGAEFPVLQPADLAQVVSDSSLELQPHLRLLRLKYPVDDLKLSARKKPSRLPKSATLYLAVHRADYSVYYKRLEAEEFAILDHLQKGETVETAITKGFEGTKLSVDEQAQMLRQCFENWGRLGWLCKEAK